MMKKEAGLLDINKNSRMPLYAQLIELVKEKIATGQLKEHDQLPTERDLEITYGISRTTIRQALIELEKEGYIYKEHGKGSFVAPQTYTQSLLRFYSFSEEMKKMGKTPTTQVISFKIVSASAKVSRILKTEENAQVYDLTRLRLADGEPMMMETTYLPVSLFPGLTKKALERKSMYDTFRSEYKIPISEARESFKAVSIGEREAIYLKEAPGNPALRIERIAYSSARVIEWTISIARGEKFVYTAELR
ncbi:GntR family transcriptional regulator [Camelliibacillus cellulosilyticus]